MRSQKKEEEEEGKCKEKQILLERLVFMNPRTSAFTNRGGEIHTFPARRRFSSEVWAFLNLGPRAHNYHLMGATAGS